MPVNFNILFDLYLGKLKIAPNTTNANPFRKPRNIERVKLIIIIKKIITAII
jgi:hypothetical protein